MTFKELDRVVLRDSYSGAVTARIPGQAQFSTSFKWDKGDPATIIEVVSQSSFWIRFDRDQTALVHVSEHWIEPLGVVKAAVATTKPCTCDVKTVLMTQGCVCGHLKKRYVEPHKRLLT